MKTVLVHAGWKTPPICLLFSGVCVWGGGGAHPLTKKIYATWGLESPGSSHGALIRPACPDSTFGVLIRPAGPWFVFQGPDPFREPWPWYVLRALIRPAGPWSAPRGPDSSCGPWSALRGPNPSRGTRVRYAEPWCFPQGPDPSHGALKPDRKSTSSRGPSGSRGPGSGLGGKIYVGPRRLTFGGHGSNPPWDRHWLRGYCPLCPAVPAPLALTTDSSEGNTASDR